MISVFFSFFFFKQKTAYEMRISDWSSDVCSSDLSDHQHLLGRGELSLCSRSRLWGHQGLCAPVLALPAFRPPREGCACHLDRAGACRDRVHARPIPAGRKRRRSEEHTSELQSLMRISYAVFCLKKKKNKKKQDTE